MRREQVRDLQAVEGEQMPQDLRRVRGAAIRTALGATAAALVAAAAQPASMI